MKTQKNANDSKHWNKIKQTLQHNEHEHWDAHAGTCSVTLLALALFFEAHVKKLTPFTLRTLPTEQVRSHNTELTHVQATGATLWLLG